MSLDSLHIILQIVMGWESEHLYDFVAGKQTYSPPTEPPMALPLEDPNVPEPNEEEMQAQVVEGLKQLASMIEHPEEQPERQAELTSLLSGLAAVEDPFGMDDEDTAMVQVSDLLKRVRSKMTYHYDFGDGWTHTIVVEKANVPTNGERPAICLDGAGACPPEDCGGPWGYMRLLEAKEHPEDPEFEDEREWMEDWIEEIDPNKFDLEAVNRALSGLTWSLELAE